MKVALINFILKNQMFKKGISPEIELLLCYARTDRDSLTAEKIDYLLQKHINWDYLVTIADEHRIMPLLYWNLKNTNPEAIPKKVFNLLETYFHTNALRNILLTKELSKIINLFKENDIAAIPFKGPVLAASIYKNLALRQFGDLDIIVQKENMLKAQNLLLSQGYIMQRKAEEKLCLTEANQNIYLQSQFRYDEWYWKTLDDKTLFGARVELHWETTAKHIIFPLNPQKLWQHFDVVSISGMDFPTLAAEELLVILCLNYSKDHWKQLKMICDIAELIRTHQQMDWKRVIEHASSLRRKRTLFLGLSLVQALLKAKLPDEILHKMPTDSVVKSLTEQVCTRIFPNCGYHPGIIENTIFNFRLRETLQDKIRYVVFSTIKIFGQHK